MRTSKIISIIHTIMHEIAVATKLKHIRLSLVSAFGLR